VIAHITIYGVTHKIVHYACLLEHYRAKSNWWGSRSPKELEHREDFHLF